MNNSLEGIKVLDLTRVLAGPYCTQMLGDLGADIIKVERPGGGDDTRGFAPPFVKNDNGEDTDLSAYYCGANRNKKSITINLSEKEGQDLVRKLLSDCDILVENFKTGTLEKYGLGYKDLKKDFPRLIYCSITGFGQTGPYASRPGYDGLIQAMGGVMSLTGDPDGEPMKVGVPTSDGYIVLSIGNDPTFERFCKLAGEEKLLGDARFKTNADRVSNREFVTNTLNEITKKHKSDWWLTELEKQKIGCGPINTLSEVFSDPHVKAREMVVQMDHKKTGKAPLKLIANPIKMEQTPPTYRMAPPLLGEHTDEILSEKIGLSKSEIINLKDKGII